MIYDFHCRIYEKTELQRISEREKALPFSDGSLSDLLLKEEACGVCKCAILNHTGENKSENAVPFYTVKDPAVTAEKFSEIYALGYYGICIDPEYLKIPVDDQRLAPAFEYAGSLGLAVIVTCGGYHFSEYAYCSTKRLCAAAERYTKTVLVFSHLGGLRVWNAEAETLCKKNVYFDTASCVFGVPPSLFGNIVGSHGADKILFGSGMPWCSPALISAFLNCADLRCRDRELVEYGNAVNLLASLR